MKSLRLVAMAMMAVMMCMNFASCSNEDVLASEDPKEPKYVTVGLGCTGEFLEFSESQMGRAATDELYGIQVYALTENGTDSYGNPTYQSTYYAYGMFTSLDNVKIKLLEGFSSAFSGHRGSGRHRSSADLHRVYRTGHSGKLPADNGGDGAAYRGRLPVLSG